MEYELKVFFKNQICAVYIMVLVPLAAVAAGVGSDGRTHADPRPDGQLSQLQRRLLPQKA